jgi:hypothetical protein
LEGGFDWGTERTVLARVQRNGVPEIDLVVVPGHMVYDRANRKKVYTTNDFMFVNYDPSGAVVTVGFKKGGRASEIVKTHGAEIDRGLGVSVASRLKAGETVVIDLP